MQELNQSGLKVRGEYVLILLPRIKKMSAGGIALPDSVTEKELMAQQIGTLVDAGPVAVEALARDGISVGAVVHFPRYNGQRYPIGEDVYWVIRHDSILGEATKMPDFGLNAAQSSTEVFGSNRQVA